MKKSLFVFIALIVLGTAAFGQSYVGIGIGWQPVQLSRLGPPV